MWIIQHLIEDTYSGGLEPMVLRPGMSPQNRLLTDLVIHVVASIQNQPNSEILKPFIEMMNSPGELKVTKLLLTQYITVYYRMCTYQQ